MATNYFRKHGRVLLDNGYNFIPIIPAHAKHKSAGKAPAFKRWQAVDANRTLVEDWEKRYPVHGIGIHTRFTPAVDIDCTDADATEYMVGFVTELLGAAPQRVGRAPKTLMLYYTEDPFTKVKSHVWEDELGERHAVEILGSGQQFVAFGIHPVTRKPYKWLGDSPLDTNADIDLNPITLKQAQQIAREFDRYAKSLGWTADPKLSAINGDEEADSWAGGSFNDDPDDWLDDDIFKTKWEGTVEELAALMEDLPAEDSYDKWFPILAALKDAEREPDEFKDIARDWSARSDNYDESSFEDKWENGSFNRLVGQVASITAIVRRVEKLRSEKEVAEVVIPDFKNCVTIVDWRRAADRLSEIAVFGTVRDVAVQAATDAFKRVTDLKKITQSALDDLAFDFSQFDVPDWLAPWVFDRQQALFVDRRSGNSIGPYSFNLSNARHLREIGVKKAADKFASEDFPIPMVDGLMYYPAMHGAMPNNERMPVPGNDDPAFFMHDGKTYLNSFDPESLPAMPESYSKSDLRAIQTVQNFFKVQFPDPKERRYVMDWLAWVVSNPTKKMNYALVIVGCEGSGKTIMKKFMTYLLGGRRNVGTVSNMVLQKSFTDWAEGHILKVIEEIDIPGHRYDVVNTLKEPIANESLQTEGKYQTANEKINTASYMAFTNQKGAIPVGEESRRYLVVASYFADRQVVLDFSAKNPRFFKSFELAFLRSAGAIRKWFGEWELSPGFDREGHAPSDTKARGTMHEMNKDAFVEAIENAVASKDVPGVTEEAIHAIGINAVFDSVGSKAGATTARRLSEMGYQMPAGQRVRIRVNGVQGSVYVKNPAKWGFDTEKPDLHALAKYLQKHADSISDFGPDDDEL